MKRNWDTIRKILIKVESLPTEDSDVDSNAIEGVDSATAAYHIRLLIESGLIIGNCRNSIGAPWCMAQRLTWEGHEFLDKIKRETVWNKVKEQAMKSGIDLSFDVVKQSASNIITGLLA